MVGAEQKIFDAVRVGAACGLVLSVAVAGYLLASAATTSDPSAVQFEEVRSAIRAAESEGSSSPALSDVVMSSRVDRFMEGENRPILAGWLAGLEGREKQDFVDNLDDVLHRAEIHGVDPALAVNTYKDLKLRRLQSSQFSRYVARLEGTVKVGSALGFLMFAMLCALGLVLLAIERNTRRPVDESATLCDEGSSDDLEEPSSEWTG